MVQCICLVHVFASLFIIINADTQTDMYLDVRLHVHDIVLIGQ